jgi:hypothetical protein
LLFPSPTDLIRSVNVVCLHHRLGGFSSHHYNEARGLLAELGQRGIRLELLVNARAEPAIVAELGAQAVLDDPTFRLEWSFEERSRRFRSMLHKHSDRLLGRDDVLLVTIATQLEAHALTLWLRERPRRKRPWVMVLFLSDRWNRAGREEYERQAAEFREVAAAIASLDDDETRRMIFCAVTELLAAELRELLGTEVGVAPLPQRYGDPLPQTGASGATRRPLVTILGGTRREKGSYLIPDIIRACRTEVDVAFLVHLTNNTLTPAEAEQLAGIAGEPQVSVIRDALPLLQYETAVAGADLALFPYEVVPYRKRCSGVFAEAVAYGKPVVVTPGTWLAAQVEAGRAAGIVSEDFEPSSIARAIARCVAGLDPLTRQAQSLSAEWRRTNSLPAFVDFLQAEIARRKGTEGQRRRWFRL